MTGDHGTPGFKRRTRLAEARETLLDTVSPVEGTETVSLESADGRVLAEPVVADRPVPHYRRAAMDGFAVRAADTFDATERSPARLRLSDDVGARTATRVHTGSALPEGADAVVMVEHVETVGEELEVFDAVAQGENVSPVGEDVSDDEELFERGRRLDPADLGVAKSVGRDAVTVYERPDIAVIPTGEELVQTDPDPGEVVETNGLTTSRFVDRWGATPHYEDVVTDDWATLRTAIEGNLAAEVHAVVTTGGSSVGERDIVPDVVADVGEVLVHGVAIKPGHPVAVGVVEETPILMLPGYPVSCLVTAVQFLAPLVTRLGRLPPLDYPTVEARLDRKIASEPGVRSFVRVSLGSDDEGPTAIPVRAGGAGVLSSVTRADGWVTVPERSEGFDAGERVDVQDWSSPRRPSVDR